VPVTAIDMFCGVGGLTHGVVLAGIPVAAGVDIDGTCRFAYEANNNSVFIERSIQDVTAETLAAYYPPGDIRILMGCAPCQPFSSYTRNKDKYRVPDKWGLLYEFLRIVREVMPHVVSMENVPRLIKEKVFGDFVRGLESLHYNVWVNVVYCPDYGIPQTRARLVLLASSLGPISLLPPTHAAEDYLTVRDAIHRLPALKAGEQCPTDPLHIAARLSPKNIARLGQSKPGGSWLDWDPTLLAECHKKKSGQSYKSIYSRMEWGKPSPTITTQFFGYGNGRFGHPEQDRALSLREGAILQTFPPEYNFIEPDKKLNFGAIGRHIGNAVPVRLGTIIGQSILGHVEGL
jgi:DNA (cytosine-5)-methyltransferase 1